MTKTDLARMSEKRPRVLIFAPHTFNGIGPGESCACIAKCFPPDLDTEIFAVRGSRVLPATVRFRPVLSGLNRHLPFRFTGKWVLRRLVDQFATALSEADPATTIAYFWPQPPLSLIETARRRGIVTVREMINTALGHAGPILDRAYSRVGLEQQEPITGQRVAAERKELALYDYVFASNPEVEKSLLDIGLHESRILSTTFGWNSARFPAPTVAPQEKPRKRLRFVFAGIIGVRKGVPFLLEAWKRAGIDAELVLAGLPDSDFAKNFSTLTEHNVRTVGFVHDLSALFRDSDIFVFPTLEEGGPQVVYEAAACGLPIITTPAGAGRFVETGLNGLVVESGSIEDLVDAMRLLAGDSDTRDRYGKEAQRGVLRYSYDAVGRERRDLLLEALARGRGISVCRG